MLIFDIKRFAVHDGPGIRTTVFLKGCPLRCWWCHNPESQDSKPVTVDVMHRLNGKNVRRKKTYGEELSAPELLERLKRDRVFYDESGGGVTFSGGEPMMQSAELEGMLELCAAEGFHITLDTSGYSRREDYARILTNTDLFLYDLKNMDPGLHHKNTGQDNALILDNADFLLDQGAKLIFRIPVIPGVNTSEAERVLFINFLQERVERLEEVHLLPYHRIADHKYQRLGMPAPPADVPEPPGELIACFKRDIEETGLRVHIGG